jgi:hypothetical protein
MLLKINDWWVVRVASKLQLYLEGEVQGGPVGTIHDPKNDLAKLFVKNSS